MNADILKPYLQHAVEAFPGHEVTVMLQTTNRPIPNAEHDRFQALIRVNGSEHFWGEDLDSALTGAMSQFTPEKAARKLAAQKLRDQADRIANGTDPLPVEKGEA